MLVNSVGDNIMSLIFIRLVLIKIMIWTKIIFLFRINKNKIYICQKNEMMLDKKGKGIALFEMSICFRFFYNRKELILGI